jgi:hypothetical protein
MRNATLIADVELPDVVSHLCHLHLRIVNAELSLGLPLKWTRQRPQFGLDTVTTCHHSDVRASLLKWKSAQKAFKLD